MDSLRMSSRQLAVARKKIVSGIRQSVKNAKANGVVIALSGGIDSSLVAKLASEASVNIYGLVMPEVSVNRHSDMEDAVELARSLGMKYSIIEINRIVGQIFRGFPWRRFSPSERKTAMTNVKPRVRMIYDYIISNLDGRIVLGTTNKTEMLLGYFTKHGDGACDLEPLGCLYKTQVMQLAHFVGVPAHIIHKTPSAGLWVGQTDESEIGMSYGEMDSILSCIHDRKMTLQQAVRETGLSRSKVERISGLVKGSSHKRMMPPVIEI